jgi:hypothetical protein
MFLKKITKSLSEPIRLRELRRALQKISEEGLLYILSGISGILMQRLGILMNVL